MNFSELPLEVQIIAVQMFANRYQKPSSMLALVGSESAKSLAQEIRDAFIEFYSPAVSESTPNGSVQKAE